MSGEGLWPIRREHSGIWVNIKNYKYRNGRDLESGLCEVGRDEVRRSKLCRHC
jgi:hypothetical protein